MHDASPRHREATDHRDLIEIAQGKKLNKNENRSLISEHLGISITT